MTRTGRKFEGSAAGVFAIGTLLLSGCAQPPASVNTVGPAERRAIPTPVADERLITDEVFAQAAVITGLIEGITPDGLRIVEAEVQNATRAHAPFKYRTAWFDERGLEVRAPTVVWRHVVHLSGPSQGRVTSEPLAHAEQMHRITDFPKINMQRSGCM